MSGGHDDRMDAVARFAGWNGNGLGTHGAVDWALGTGDALGWFRRLLSAHAAAQGAETGLEVALLQEAACSLA